MARDAVDGAAKHLDVDVPSSTTKYIPLVGAIGFNDLWSNRDRIAPDVNLDPSHMEHLLGRYGTLVHEALDMIRDQPDLGEPLEGAENYLAVEIAYAVSHEGALHLDDVLTRRTRISIETADRGVGAAKPAAALMAEELGWDEATVIREIEHYVARVNAELDSQDQMDDRTADAARLGAPDVRMGGT